ncbi:YhaN family protein [Pacificoceanicola onchidii]|uniref:YhaN family protein n=1 Tax=Pacificoceanicola onchidii TaxID=2562685 RepID=UPI001F0D4FA0|nr:YhaN family protein [Pacificoceanicola onchidii]
MRLRRLDLDLFGHFAGKSYDFGEAGETADFHVIYGPNEAGKTTTMEAFLRLLYGFPHRESYDFKHSRANLQISADLETARGALTLTRTAKRKGNLLDQNGGVLPEASLQAHLGGLSEADYRQLLCLDDDTIEKGGEEIVSSKGDIGNLLFSAAAGISDLSAVLDGFRAQAGALYKKKVRSTRMAELKAELAEVTRQIKDSDVTAAAWRKLRQEMEAAQAEEASAREDSNGLWRRKAELDAQRTALPLLVELDAVEADLAGTEGVPEALGFKPEDLVELAMEQSRLRADQTHLTKDLADLREARDGVRRKPDLLALDDALVQVEDLYKRFSGAELDLGRRRQSVAGLRADLARAAQDLQAEDIEPRRLLLDPATLQSLEAARDAMTTAQHDRARQARDLAEAEARLEETPDVAVPDQPISALLDQYAAGRLAPKYAAAAEAMGAAERGLARALSMLGMETVPEETLPEAEVLAQRHGALETQLGQLEAEQADRLTEITAANRRIAQMLEAGTLIGDETAQAETEAREALWQAHLEDLKAESAAAFETALRRVDLTAAARLAQASDLAQVAHERRALVDLEARAQGAAAKIKGMSEERDALLAQVHAAAKAAGLESQPSPEGFLRWQALRQAAEDAQRALEEARMLHAPVLTDGQALLAALKNALAVRVGDFETVLAEAERRAEAERAAQGAAREAQQRRAEVQAEVARRTRQGATVAQAAAEAAEAWSDAVRKALPAGIKPEVLSVTLEPLRRVREIEGKLAQDERRVESMEADHAAFDARMTALAEQYGVEAPQGPEAAYKALKTEAAEAARAEEVFEDLTLQIASQEAALAEANEALSGIDRQITAWAAVFPADVTTLDALRDATGAALSVNADRKKRAGLVTQLCTGLGVPDLSEARAALRGISAQDVASELAALEQGIETQASRLREATERRTLAERALNAVTGDADVARLTEQKATLEAAIEDTALRYVELNAGIRLAEEAIRRYRDTHRSGMMAATEAAFAELTNGAYMRLMTQADGDTETLVALTREGQSKQAQDMSKGTRFQLYLALRAAAYAQLVQEGTCLPFFCDDVFETFDEDRTRAACRVMARIGQQGQAIYLTHHKHVVDIAREVCPDAVTIHSI